MAIFLIPFFYSVCTRLPFVCIAIVLWKIGFSFEAIAAGICGYQIMRGISNSIQKQGDILMRSVFLSVGGLIGYALVLWVDLAQDTALSADRELRRLLPQHVAMMLLGFVFVGLSEIYTCIQWMCKHWAFLHTGSLTEELDYCRLAFKQQYCIVNLGATVAFFLGGLVFEYRGLRGVALLGVCDATCLIVLIVTYRLMDPIVQARMGHPSCCGYEHHRPAESDEASLDRSAPYTGTKPRKVQWIAWFVAVTFGFQSASIGVILSIGPFFWFQNFNLDVFYVGLLMAAGELLGFIETLLDLNSHVVNFKRWLLPNPWSIIFLLALIMVCDAWYMTLSFWPVLVAQVLIQGCNGMCVAVLTEIQGCILDVEHYQHVAGISQVVRRVGNVTMAAMAPILYGVYPGLPFLMAGIITALWCVVLIVAFIERRHELERKVIEKWGTKSERFARFKQATFITGESAVAIALRQNSLTASLSSNSQLGKHNSLEPGSENGSKNGLETQISILPLVLGVVAGVVAEDSAEKGEGEYPMLEATRMEDTGKVG
eukprot:CAMPEP_0195062220 /NCGR_PEP_ID=MMETSP0448-20130528/8885_1 /TAXON_ID=66468 /ORGANISM="Heterocapsa triquestra, Strain CCMP 448" /LENGTH=541 /DNA_ID=CAMNT_0040092877 /DNA_START=127 /DNA_END=1749 /DNA_ORIENTATION=+